MPNEKELLAGFLSKTLNLDAAGVASLYKEDGSELKPDALDTLLSLDVERVKSLKPDTKKIFDDGYKKAQSESLTKLEKEFKEKTSFQSDKIGIDLFLEYAATQAKDGKITEDLIKKHPLFISTVDALKKEKEDAVLAESKKLNDFQLGLKKKETFGEVATKALELFHADKPILPKDPSVAQNQRTLLLEKLESYEYEKQGDKFIVLKDGKVLEDDHGNRISFEALVKQTSKKYYEFQVADHKSSPNNKQEGDKKVFTFEVPKNDDQYAALVAKTSSLEERVAIKEAYAKSKELTT